MGRVPSPSFGIVKPPIRNRNNIHVRRTHAQAIVVHTDVRSVVLLHDNVHIVGGSEDGTMQKWNHRGNPVGKPWKGKGGSIYAMALSPDGRKIACGRADGSIQRWNSDGKMEGAWKGHSDRAVRSLSWSPSGGHIASGFDDGKILIRKADSGQIKVDPIKVGQGGWVRALAYSPSGERIASGGSNTICIWNTKTGKLDVGPIEDLGYYSVVSLVWSSDSTNLYSASDNFARVFDSTSGALLHRFEHDSYLYSVALSPQNDILACVGNGGVAQLWDTKSYQPLGQSFSHERKSLYCVSFSRNGKYLACGKPDGKIAVWFIDNITSELAAPILHRQGHRELEAPQLETRRESLSSSYLDADATGGDVIIEEARNDPYDNFFPSSRTSLPAATSSLPQPPNLSSARRFWNTISRNRKPACTESTPLQERPKRKILAHFARSNSPKLPNTTSDQPMPDGQLRAREQAEQIDQDADLGTMKPENGKEDQREGSLTDAQLQRTSKLESEENRNIWGRLMGARRKDSQSVNIAPITRRPEFVDVYAVRGFQRIIASPKRWKKSSAVPLTAVHTGNSSQLDPSSKAGSAQAGTLLQASSAQGGPPSTIHGTKYLQVVGDPLSHTSGPLHSVTTNYHTTHNSDSRSSVEGSCNRFLDKICYPCGHYY